MVLSKVGPRSLPVVVQRGDSTLSDGRYYRRVRLVKNFFVRFGGGQRNGRGVPWSISNAKPYRLTFTLAALPFKSRR